MAASIYLRGAQGLWTVDGAKYSAEVTAQIDPSNACKCMVFSDDGNLFAWSNTESVQVLDTNTMKVLQTLPVPKVVCLQFSPLGTVLATWNNYVVNREAGAGTPNLHIFDVKTGKTKSSLIQKKQIGWAPEWSKDEVVCVRNVNNELQFYENNDFGKIANRLQIQKVTAFGLAKSASPYVIAGYAQGTKGQPSFVRVYRYPNFRGVESALANKSFFKAERVHFYWNKAGNSLLVLTSTETSDTSYYGEQGLHFMATNGESCLVPMQKPGPVYHVEWAPSSLEYVVIHGYMPAKTTIYNLKCEPVFDFGTGPRNICAYNPQGNILCLAGFGNLAGNLEFWDMKQKKQIIQTKAVDTTHFEWSPDGQHLLTSTTAPRLRVGNGYRIWHYSGTLMLQNFTTDHAELWEARWRPRPIEEVAQNFDIVAKPVATAVVEQPKPKAAAYRPPHARGASAPMTKPLQEYEAPSNEKKQDPNKPMSKNKKKKEAKKAKAAQEASEGGPEPVKAQVNSSGDGGASGGGGAAAANFESTGDPEKDKKIRNLRKKVQQIEKLKEQQAFGKQLEKNQLDKIKTLDSILQEIEDLELS